jgi:hypothetical protein
MLTTILQLRRRSKSRCGARFSHLIHQLRLESRWSFRDCLLSIPTMDTASYRVGLRETTHFHSEETSFHAHPEQSELPRLAICSSPSRCCLGTLLCCFRDLSLVFHSHLDIVSGTGVWYTPDSHTSQTKPAASWRKREHLGIWAACTSHTTHTAFFCCLGASDDRSQ